MKHPTISPSLILDVDKGLDFTFDGLGLKGNREYEDFVKKTSDALGLEDDHPARLKTKPNENLLRLANLDDMKTQLSIKDIIQNNRVAFSRYRKGYLYYTINYDGSTYEFPVDIEDTGDADFLAEDKAIMFMRYIRLALKEDTFNKVG